MGFLRAVLRYLAAPVFFVMAGVTWLLHHQAARAPMAGMDMSENGATILVCILPPVSSTGSAVGG